MKPVYPDLVLAKEKLYNPCGFVCSSFEIESESAEYSAAVFELNDYKVRFRSAKITPNKTGQFVTLWKRSSSGKIQPYSSDDLFDFVVISAQDNDKVGQFVFPQAILLEQGILASSKSSGKLGFRVYPAWDAPVSSQAKKTQEWQLNFFLEIPLNGSIDFDRADFLYSL